MTVIEGGFQCLYMQIASGKIGDPNDANKPHRRQLGVGESGNCNASANSDAWSRLICVVADRRRGLLRCRYSAAAGVLLPLLLLHQGLAGGDAAQARPRARKFTSNGVVARDLMGLS